ncbi:MAG TPA: proton-conducting transporter membrane subunit [Candidatus Acidoferrum sp.]|nr:proton-conducting transporter membrane subunit [Candidatus Acidoferrum sp.]
MNAWIGGALAVLFAVCGCGLVLSAIMRGRYATRVLVGFSTISSALMMIAAGTALASGRTFSATLWPLDGLGLFSIRLDMLSAIFLFAAGLVYLPASLFVKNLVEFRYQGQYPLSRYGVMHVALMASVVLVLIASDALLFLISWECMSILCYLLVNYERRRNGDERAAFIMLAMSEAGFLAVVVAFAIAARMSPDWSFGSLAGATAHLSNGAIWAVFMLGLFGFGVKAGLVPVNFWLPRCYTATPAIFVPVLAGVTLNLGFYGILRLNADIALPHGIGPGLLALFVGSLTALVGILYATTENDMKTMLAHSSIENAGIIVAGIGASLVFRSSGYGLAAAIALTAALYHMVNHSVYKTLLFEGVGEIEAATGTRDMDSLGGLARVLPALSAIFLVGCLSIAAIPPFNGFVSEWLTLQSLLRSASLLSPAVKILFAICGAALALTAALAVTCFVKVYAMSFLGIRRGDWKLRAPKRIKRPHFALVYLASACFLLGILPTYVIPVLNRAVESLAGASATASLVPPFFTATAKNHQLPAAFVHDFHNIGAQVGRSVLPGKGMVLLVRGAEQNPVIFAMSTFYGFMALALFVIVTWLIVTRLTRRREVVRNELWAGGIPRLLPEMSYTATGFSNPVRVVFQAIFRPDIVEDTRKTVAVHFRTAILRRREEEHLVDRLFFHPVGDAISRFARVLAGMHHGKLNAYVAYTLLFLLLILLLYRVS